MALGLQGAFGLENAQQGLRQRIIDQLNQQKQQQEMKLAERNQTLREQEAQQRQQEFQQTLAERKAAQAERSAGVPIATAAKLAPELPMGQNLDPQALGILKAGGLGAQAYAPPTMGENVSGQPFDASTANPSVNLGTAAQQDVGKADDMRQSLLNDPTTSTALRGVLRALPAAGKTPGAMEAIAKTFQEPKESPPGQIVQTGTGYSRVAPDNTVTPLGISPPAKDPPDQGWTVKEMTGPDGKPITVRVNSRTGETQVVNLPTGVGAGKVNPQEVLWDAKKQDALGSIAEVKKSIDDAAQAGLIGPLAGRLSTLGQHFGIVDPKVSDLKTKLLAVKSKVSNALTSSNRQASPEMLRRFDELLGTQLDPQNLHAAADALASMLGPTSGTPAATETPADRAARLRKAAGL